MVFRADWDGGKMMGRAGWDGCLKLLAGTKLRNTRPMKLRQNFGGRGALTRRDD